MRVSIEGNIASGKSTLLHELARRWQVRQEPVDAWSNLLGLFYQDPQRWAFTMNAQALLSMCEVKDVPSVLVTERSPLSCKEVFSRMHKNDGTMAEKEWALLCDLFTYSGWEPDVIVYLQSSTATCLGRLRKRARNGEEEVDEDYLAKVDAAHGMMLKWYSKERKVYYVEADDDSATVLARVSAILKECSPNFS